MGRSPQEAGSRHRIIPSFTRERRSSNKPRPRRMRLATAATLLVALPGIVTATMGEGTVGPQPSVVRHGQGYIHPAGEPKWCLAGKAEPGGAPPQANSQVEVRPCAPDNPFQLWDVAIDETPGKPDKMIAQIHGLNLCLSGNITRPRAEAIYARVNDCNLPLATLTAKESDGVWQIFKSKRTLSVPRHLRKHEEYPVTLWIDNRFMKNPKIEETENPFFELPSLSTARG